MFEEFMGLPAHPLLLHTAVVFVPLLALGSIAYGLVPALRPRIWWLVALLSVAGAGSAYATHQSGLAFRAHLIANGAKGDLLTKLAQHKNFADITMWAAISLAVVTLALLYAAPGWGGARRRTVAAARATEKVPAGRFGPTGDAAASAVGSGAAATPARSPAGAGGGTAMKVLRIALIVVAVALSGVCLYYIYKTGDSGARIAWPRW